MKKINEQWNSYLANKSVRPKRFNITLERVNDGSFRIVGDGAKVLNVINQWQSEWTPVDARDLASALNQSGVVAK
jgi:hypothetical protein